MALGEAGWRQWEDPFGEWVRSTGEEEEEENG